MQLLKDPTPSEKLIIQGEAYLTDIELIATIIGGREPVAKAVKIYKHYPTLGSIKDASISSLSKFITTKQAAKLKAAFNLSKRLSLEGANVLKQVRSSADTYQHLAPFLSELSHEECWLLCLNRNNCIKSKHQISTGGRAGTVVDAKIIFEKALESKASSIIIAHNHPSNNLKPSNADIQLTNKIYKAGQTLDMPLLDHLIITDYSYYSFADDGNLEG